MCTVAKPYPKEFRDDVVNVARNREPGQTIKQIAADFGIAESCLRNWLRTADVEDGLKPGTTAADNTELREAKKRIRLLEQENEVLRRAAAYLSQANLPRIGRWLRRVLPVRDSSAAPFGTYLQTWTMTATSCPRAEEQEPGRNPRTARASIRRQRVGWNGHG